LLCEKMRLDVWEVIDAAATKPFGFMPFYPGPGLGGHCIPIDPFYLTWKARQFGVATRFVELAGEINTSMPDHVVDRVREALGRELRGSRILVLGVAYKAEVDDLRESPGLRILEILRARGAEVRYHDPYVPRLRDLESVPLSDEELSRCDCALIVTAHKSVDYARVVQRAPLVVDTRGATRGLSARNVV